MLSELPLLVRYTVTGEDAAYAIPFCVYRAEDVAVSYSTDGRTETALTLGTDYSVQILASGGAELTLAAGVAGAVVPAGAVLAIASAVPATQEADLSNTATLDTAALETQLDREVQMIQQLEGGLARAVKLPAASNGSPEELLDDIFTARDTAVESAGSAKANANAAAASAQSAAGNAAIATEQREAACICAGEAQDARDVAIAQAEAANILMEAELAKINAIVAANRTDQEAAVTAAQAWAEKEAEVPVAYDEEGNALYSARHWAENAQKIAIEPPTAERRGAIRVGAGLHLETGENGETDVLAFDPALGGSLRLNDEVWITASGEWTAPVTGWYDLWMIGGGQGGVILATNPSRITLQGGRSGRVVSKLVYLTAGSVVSVTIGAGTPGTYVTSANVTIPSPGETSFGELTTSDSMESFSLNSKYITSTDNDYVAGAGVGGGNFTASPNMPAYKGRYYGAGGGAGYAGSQNASDTIVGDGAQGAIRFRFWNPAKATGPEVTPATFAATRMAPRAAAAPAVVNLYDPETGQGSVWREEDAPAQLERGLITQEAWQEICAAKATEDYAEWLANPDTEAERFELLRAARDAKLAATDYLVAPDYPLTDEQRAAVTAYRQALRDLPAQEGAPWDGGGEATPWPQPPAVSNAQA